MTIAPMVIGRAQDGQASRKINARGGEANWLRCATSGVRTVTPSPGRAMNGEMPDLVRRYVAWEDRRQILSGSRGKERRARGEE